MNILEQPEFADLLSRRRTVAAGEIIFLEGQPADAVYVILQGEVQVTLTDTSGRQVVINRIRSGEMFGELELLEANQPRTASVMSNQGCELLVIDKAAVDKIMGEANPFLRYMISHLCRIIRGWTALARRT